MKRKHIKYLLFFSLCFILFSQKTFAINTCAEGWKVDVGSNNKKTIDCHGICKIVTNNNCSASVFVPTQTSAEWSEFLTHFPSCISVTDCCDNECSYSGQTEYRCSGSWVQYRTCGNYDSDPCLEWSSWSNYENCDSYDGCSGGYYYNYYCSNGYCDYSSSCTESCCDEYYGDSRAYCSGGYCYGPPSTPTPTPTPTRTPTPTPAPSCSASLSCQSSTENSITLSYSFSNCGAMYLYRGSTNLKNLGSGTQSGTYTDSNLSPGTSYTYYLKEGNTTKATQTCSTSAIEPKLPNCSFSGNSGIWAGMKDVAWSDSGCYICNSPNECGTCCGYCRSQLSGSYRFIYKKNWLGFRENDLRTSGGPTFVASDGWDASKTTKLCKIGNTPNISICPFSGGEKGRFYVTNEYAIQYAKIDLSNKSNWIPILYPECGSWQGFKVGGQDYHFSQCPNPDYDNCNYYVETYGCFGSDASLARCWFNWWEWPLGGSNIPSPCRICYVP